MRILDSRLFFCCIDREDLPSFSIHWRVGRSFQVVLWRMSITIVPLIR